MKTLEIKIQGQSFTVRVEPEKEGVYLEVANEVDKSLEEMIDTSNVKSIAKIAIMYAFGMKLSNKVLEQEIEHYKEIDLQIDECLSIIDLEEKDIIDNNG